MANAKSEVDWAGCSSGCFAAILDVTVFPLLYGWVIAKLWLWFIVPGFNVRPISVALAAGIDLILSLATAHGFLRPKHDYTASEYGFALFAKALFPFMALLVGWFVLKVANV